jgi:hypothetical protein
MQLSQKAIDEFKQIWFEKFGEKISDEKAEEEGSGLLELYKIFIKYIDTDLPKTDKRINY